jgi:hypothetical protein
MSTEPVKKFFFNLQYTLKEETLSWLMKVTEKGNGIVF